MPRVLFLTVKVLHDVQTNVSLDLPTPSLCSLRSHGRAGPSPSPPAWAPAAAPPRHAGSFSLACPPHVTARGLKCKRGRVATVLRTLLFPFHSTGKPSRYRASEAWQDLACRPTAAPSRLLCSLSKPGSRLLTALPPLLPLPGTPGSYLPTWCVPLHSSRSLLKYHGLREGSPDHPT